MEDNLKSMLARHKQEVKTLQDSCPHEKVSDFMDEWWGPGHLTGRRVKCCKKCGKVVESLRWCQTCKGSGALTAEGKPALKSSNDTVIICPQCKGAGHIIQKEG
jgi:RNA polymerase subunit RPABC4/transcription elongation factor Spt4